MAEPHGDRDEPRPRPSRYHVDNLNEYLEDVPVSMKPMAFLEWLIDPVDQHPVHDDLGDDDPIEDDLFDGDLNDDLLDGDEEDG